MPLSDLDASIINKIKLDAVKNQYSNIKTYKEIIRIYNILLYKNHDIPQQIINEFNSLFNRMKNIEKNQIFRPNQNYSILSREINDFWNQFKSKIEMFISNDSAKTSDIDSLSGIISNFILHLKMDYCGFEDVIMPIMLSLYMIKEGLRFLKRNEKEMVNEQELIFPLYLVNKSDFDYSDDNKIKLNLYKFYIRNTICSNEIDKNVFIKLFDQYVLLYEKSMSNKANVDSDPINKIVHKQITTEEEIEKNFRQQFPDNFNELEEFLFSEEIKDLQINSFTMDEIKIISDLFLSYFNSKSDFVDKTYFRTYNLLSKIYSNSLDTDVLLQPHHLHIILHLKNLQMRTQLNLNFQKDINLIKNQDIIEPLQELINHIFKLIELFPENAILISLLRASQRLSQVSIYLPLSVLLPGLLLLLRKCQDWEIIAAKHVSLSNELSKLNKIVIDWRKIELNSYKLLLEDEYNNTCSLAKINIISFYTFFKNTFKYEIKQTPEHYDWNTIEWTINNETSINEEDLFKNIEYMKHFLLKTK